VRPVVASADRPSIGLVWGNIFALDARVIRTYHPVMVADLGYRAGGAASCREEADHYPGLFTHRRACRDPTARMAP